MTVQAQNQTDKERVKSLADEKAHLPGALLPILNAVQDELGWVPDWSVPIIAETLNLSRADVHGVVSFYHLYRKSPPGKHTLYVCCSEACKAMGASALTEAARKHLGVDFHETSEDGRFSLEPIYCLGNCACAPAVMVDETLHGRVTPEGLEKILSGGGA